LEKFDIRQYKYTLILIAMIFLFALIVSNAYKYLPKTEKANSATEQEFVQQDEAISDEYEEEYVDEDEVADDELEDESDSDFVEEEPTSADEPYRVIEDEDELP